MKGLILQGCTITCVSPHVGFCSQLALSRTLPSIKGGKFECDQLEFGTRHLEKDACDRTQYTTSFVTQGNPTEVPLWTFLCSRYTSNEYIDTRYKFRI